MSTMSPEMLQALVKDTVRILSIPPQRSEVPVLVSFVAPPGSGKTYLSEVFASRLHCTLLSAEKLQTYLNPSPTYFSLKIENIFELSQKVIKELLTQKINVVFDCNLVTQLHRLYLDQLAKNCHGSFVLINITVPDEVVIERLSKKNAQVAGGTRYGVILNREYYLAEKNRIEHISGEYITYDSSLGEAEVERVVGLVRQKMGVISSV